MLLSMHAGSLNPIGRSIRENNFRCEDIVDRTVSEKLFVIFKDSFMHSFLIHGLESANIHRIHTTITIYTLILAFVFSLYLKIK